MSKICLYLCVATILLVHFCYYPKWQKPATEATISWDVSGYYMYLPALFIYEDIKQCNFKDEILKKYHPTPDFQQAFIHEESGNYVMKYPVGQALVFSPFFGVAHLWALYDARYPSDGFSLPYQFLISIGALLISILGLIYLRKSLLVYFRDRIVGLALLGIVFGTNYLNYAAIDGAMTHNSLFTIYAILIWLSIQFYKKPTLLKSIGIGIGIGSAALIRPTEIISCLIPLLWGINLLSKERIVERIKLVKSKWIFFLTAAITVLVIGSIQLIYWKYASGDWLVYSYQNQGFSWLSPHIKNGLISYKSGWLVYSPLMIFALIGFIPLYRHKKHLFFVSGVFFLLFTYIAFAWDIWWYGGSLGQRTMVQAYPILALPLCMMIESTFRKPAWIKRLVLVLTAVFIYANIWFTHQAHKGGLLHVGHMNKSYFWKTLFTYEHNPENLKLLDRVREIYEGELLNKKTIFEDSTFHTTLDNENQLSVPIEIPFTEMPYTYDWIRVSVNASINAKEWNLWTMTQFVVEIKNQSEVNDKKMIRIQRHIHDGQSKNIFLDIRKPNRDFTALEVKFWNAGGQKQIILENLLVETFEEE